MFPLEAIVLRKIRIDERRIILTCFSSEYGKIDIFHRESPSIVWLDTLSHFTGQIRTKEHNTISNIYRVTSFAPRGNYDLYDLAGWSVSILYNLLPLGLPYPKLFQILKSVTINSTTYHHDILLFLIQTCRDFGIVQCDLHHYVDILQHEDGQKQVRSDIEWWVNAYMAS
jgi:recombinational DNA repair protein (RecF pathway)